jgi:hypothetical protein
MTEIEQLKRHATEMANANNAGIQGMSKREAMERVLPPPVRRHCGGTPAALARFVIAAAQRCGLSTISSFPIARSRA